MNKHRTVQEYLALLFLAMFFYGLCVQMVGTMISRIILHYDIKMAQAGLLSSFQYAGNFVAVFIVTVFSGRINKIIILGVSVLFLAASFCIISTAPLFGILLVNFSMMGIFYSALDTHINSIVADLRPDNIRVSMSFLHGLYGLGGLSCPIVIERLAIKFSWTQVYFIISMVLIFYFVVYVLFVKLHWGQLSTRLPHAQQARFGFLDMIQFFKLKRNVFLWIAMFSYIGSHSIVSIWIKRYVETHLNEPAWGAYALSAFWIGVVLSRFVVSPNIKAPSLLKITVGNLIFALVLATGLLSGSVYFIVAATLVAGLSAGFTIPLLMAQSCEWYQEKTSFGTLMPLTSLYFSFAVFPPVSGFISDNLGIPWGVALGAICAFMTAVFSEFCRRLSNS